MNRFYRNSRGDTIIEVLIAIAVVSSVLSISFAIANRSTLAGRQAYERSEAIKVAESQIELVKAFVSTQTGNLPGDLLMYCMHPTNQVPTVVQGFIPSLPPAAANSRDVHANTSFRDIVTFPAACRAGIGSRYRIALINEAGVVSVIVRWDKPGGSATDDQDQVVMVYKINET
jgi:type II secretory pathway pseudopilin PulG